MNFFTVGKTHYILLLVFFLGLLVRFLYFPDNVYFAYDQARDAYTALEILKGDFKLIGPPSFLNDKLFPGPLIFYIYAPILLLFDKNPEAISAFLRFFNSLGIILTFFIGSAIFNKKVGLLSALLFALSYEQTQYALFISHQPQAVITILIFYLGLSWFIFKNNTKGIALAALGWGLSIQFHYGYVLLIIPLLTILVIFRKNFQKLNLKEILISLIVLTTTLSTFIIVEFKYHFFSYYLKNPSASTSVYFKETILIINRFFHDIFLANYRFAPFITITSIVIYFAAFIFRRNLRQKLLFLTIWFLGGLTPYLISGVSSYYYSAAASVSLLIAISYLTSVLLPKYQLIGVLLFLLVIVNNLNQIITVNKTGVNSDMVIQPGMLTSDQKRALDYIYSQGKEQNFSINSLTVPLYVNTTWSYLFEWYGKNKYGFLPIYGGDAALGYQGNLKINKTRSQLPTLQFLIIEPTLGIREGYQNKFLREESYFTKIIEEKNFGKIIVQKRRKI